MSHKKQPIPREKSHSDNRVWDGINYIHTNLMAYTVYPAVLTPFMRNKELIAKVQNIDELVTISGILATDVKAFSEKLNAIHAEHAGKSGNTINADDHMLALQIGQSYVAWTESYDAVVLPNVVSILEIFEAAGADVDSARRPAASDVVNVADVLGGSSDE